MKNIELDDGDRMRALVATQGIMLFEDISNNLDANKKNFDKTIENKEVPNGKQKSMVKVV
jgi:hypothetical protein